MNDTRMSTVSTAPARTWWWHPKPVAAIDAMSATEASGTWWWHPKPVI